MGSSFLKYIYIYIFYLCYKVSDEGDVGVELLQTLADVADHGQDVATAQQVDHPVQQSLLQLQLEGSGGWGGGQSVISNQFIFKKKKCMKVKE